MQINNNEIKALLEASRNAVFDPDILNYPHLYTTRTYTDDEMGSYDDAPEASEAPAEAYVIEEKTFEARPARNFTPRNLKPYSGIYRAIPNSILKAAGWRRSKKSDVIMHVEPDEWIDIDTGEILSKSKARKLGAVVSSSTSLRMTEALTITFPCPPTKRPFQAYILKLRSKRGGLIVDLKTALDRWIDHADPNVDSTDRARKRGSLEDFLYKRNILSDNQTFSKPLQVIGTMTKTDNLREAARFTHVLPVMGKPGCGIREGRYSTSALV